LEKIDPTALAAVALAKCQQSVHPQALEPGRYMTILEPQATADLFAPLFTDEGTRPMQRKAAEGGLGPFASRERGRSKLGQLVLDRRLMVQSDPMDPDGGFIPFTRDDGTPFQSVTWIDQGVLKELAYDRNYALSTLNLDRDVPLPTSFRLAAAPGVPTTTVEAMIAKTERGILVTRFTQVVLSDAMSMQCTGFTRDGLWLIEHGKLARAIKNFRFTASAMFVFNTLVDIGVSQRVFAPEQAWVAPAIRVPDFNFTSLVDAV
jgi:predicted Zn-dependent protease